ncbi:unnamed protein product [Durusdinium trenchii]|uniref:CID domain-containing protein n=1 Tax=Durusdinium trenchii TaxID=1381693 RepID=A0ABP0SZB3_9DINO
MKQVLLERSHLFEVQLDSKFQPHVRLISSGVDLSAWSHLSAVCAASAAIAGLANRAAESPPAPLTTLPVEAPETAALGPELLSALEMHLTRRNGHERYSVLRSKFGVKQAQLRPYFQVLPAGHDAVVALCHEPGGAMPKVPGPMNSSVQEAVEGLTLLLGELNTRRCSIGRAMAFCMDRAESHAALLSRRMCSALSEPLPSVEALARFYLVNDVLHNAASEKPGAQQFRESFQDLLPEACEGFGRQWLRRLELPLREPMERRVRSVLHGWETWSIFPRLYIKGLEALLFSPVTTRLDTGCEDAALERKLQRWRLPGDPTQLPCAARRRGLAGKAQKAEVCRARLCHFERYWHRPGVEEPDSEPEAPETVLRGASRPLAKSLRPGAVCRYLRGDEIAVCERWDESSNAWHVRRADGRLQLASPEQLIALGGNEEGDDLDGEELTLEELQELDQAEEPPAKRKRSQLVIDLKRIAQHGNRCPADPVEGSLCDALLLLRVAFAAETRDRRDKAKEGGDEPTDIDSMEVKIQDHLEDDPDDLDEDPDHLEDDPDDLDDLDLLATCDPGCLLARERWRLIDAIDHQLCLKEAVSSESAVWPAGVGAKGTWLQNYHELAGTTMTHPVFMALSGTHF